MKWSLLELRKYQETLLTFHEILDLKETLMERDNLLLDVEPVKVKGFVSVDKKGYTVHYTVQTVLTVPSTRSLEPVALSLDFSIDELFMTMKQYQSRDDQLFEEDISLIKEAHLDLRESIEDNLLLAIPMRVLTKEEEQSSDMPRGTDWEILSEDEYQRRKLGENKVKGDSRLAKLSELFDLISISEDINNS